MLKINKLFFSLLTICFFHLNLAAQDGIQFEKGEWESILKKAKTENKLIFLDAYTTWCGPCKKMDRDVFPDKSVGELYNKMFINAKMDMEKGDGIGLAMNYNINAYPTMLFLDGDGKVVHRSAGFHNIKQFLELGTKAIDPNSRLTSLEKRYKDGDRTPSFLRNYTKIRYEIADGSHQEIAEEYLKTQKDWKKEENSTFLFRYVHTANSPLFDYLIENKDHFIELYGQATVTKRVQQLIYASVEDTSDESGLEQVKSLFRKIYQEKGDQMASRFAMTYYRQAGDREGYMDAATAYFKSFPPDNQEEWNEAAWTFYKITTDKKRLKQAIKFAKKSAKINKNYYNLDTLAHIYHTLKKRRKAKKYAKAAILLAERDGLEHQETLQLLRKIDNKE